MATTARALGAIRVFVMTVCRFYVAPPPGGLFFVVASEIGVQGTVHGWSALMQVGAVALGTVLPVDAALLGSLRMAWRHGVPAPSPPLAAWLGRLDGQGWLCNETLNWRRDAGPRQAGLQRCLAALRPQAST